MVGVAVFVEHAVTAHDLGRASGEQGSDDRVFVSIVVAHDRRQRSLQQVADGDALADVQVAERVNVQAFGMTQLLPGAPVETLPGPRRDTRCEFFGRTATKQDGRLAGRQLAGRTRNVGSLGFRHADEVHGNT